MLNSLFFPSSNYFCKNSNFIRTSFNIPRCVLKELDYLQIRFWWWYGVVGNCIGLTPGLVTTGLGDCVSSTPTARILFWSNQPPRSTQPGQPFVGRHSEYQPNGCHTVWLESKGRYGSCLVAGKTMQTFVQHVISECFRGEVAALKHYTDPCLVYLLMEVEGTLSQ